MNDGFSIAGKIIANIVKESDEYTMQIIEKYVKDQEQQCNIIYSTVIGEGLLRHVINLGLQRLNELQVLDAKPHNLFQQEEYITFLMREIHRYKEENKKLKNQIRIMENTSDIRNVYTKLGGEEN